MVSAQVNRCVLLLLVLAAAAVRAAPDAQPPALPPLAQRLMLSLPPDGLPVFEALESRPLVAGDYQGAWEPVLKRWNPVTGEITLSPLGLRGQLDAAVRIPAGILFVLLPDAMGWSFTGTAQAALLLPDGRIERGGALHARTGAMWVVLHDGSAILLQGREGEKRSRVVEWVRWLDGRVQVLHLPDRPGDGEAAFAAVGLADGRLLVTGGNDGRYRGCMPCTEQTWLLDPVAGSWSPGPAMGRARASHSASLLPDGSVLVAGGWTPVEDWSAGPTRSSERWRPGESGFESAPPLLNGSADHRVVPLPGDPSRLLLAGGTASTVQILDTQRVQWVSAGSSPTSRDGSCHVLPFRFEGRLWLWQNQRETPQYGSGGCGAEDGLWSLRALHEPASTGIAPFRTGDEGAMFDRQAAAFVPVRGERPALLVGGTAGEEGQTQSAAVDAIFADGSIRPWPPLVHARLAAFAVRLRDGVLVWGGYDGASNARDNERRALPAEWLDERVAEVERQWIVLPTPALQLVALGVDATDRALALGARGEMLRVDVVDNGDGLPRLSTTTLADLPAPRLPESLGERRIALRGLADGRIVVAGGQAAVLRVARWRPDDADPDLADDYVGVGPIGPTATHAIREPDTGRWHESAPAQWPGGRVAILDDGRVLKVATDLVPAVIDAAGEEIVHARWRGHAETSSTDGQRWESVASPAVAGVDFESGALAIPFVLDGELLLAAEGTIRTGGQPGVVLRHDPALNTWQTLWSAHEGDNWRAHVGRVVQRELAAGRGLVFPVAGE